MMEFQVDNSILSIHSPGFSYLPVLRGHFYLVAIIDWFSRRVLSWRISSTLDATFWVESLENVIAYYGIPEIFNSDQRSQFTSKQFTDILRDKDVKTSMDGKGQCYDNIFIERLWRSLGYWRAIARLSARLIQTHPT